MKNPLERLIQNLSKHLQAIAKRLKRAGTDNAKLLFDEVNAMYPSLLQTADEASTLFEKSGASKLAERYFESLTDAEIWELNNELND